MPQQTDRTIYVGSVGKEVDEPALLALFGHCGTVRLAHPSMLLFENVCCDSNLQHRTLR